jgi:hypothetical protein
VPIGGERCREVPRGAERCREIFTKRFYREVSMVPIGANRC